MKYEDVYNFSKEKTLQKIRSESEKERITGLLELVHSETLKEESLKYAIEYSLKENEWEVVCGIQCFGHLARIHKEIDLTEIRPILLKLSLSEIPRIQGACEDAIADIAIFQGVEIK